MTATTSLEHSNHSESRPSGYVGRFAPSPTGPLHFGSLLAALASYLDARAHNGRWLVRIENLDPPREDPQAADSILHILEAYGFDWDGDVRYQSDRNDAYEAVLQQLIASADSFPCVCSRKQLAGNEHLDGQCVAQPPAFDRHSIDLSIACAWRFKVAAEQQQPLCFDDRLQGRFCLTPSSDIGDFVIRRRDFLWSYQLAVITDDHDQGITHVVRGIDLIDSTQRQILMHRALGWPSPSYMHIPVAVERNGQKLSKQNLARALQADDSGNTLWTALDWLRQQPPESLRGAGNTAVLQWAVEHWQPDVLKGLQQLPAPEGFQRSGV
ncbi:tRNA glutamyl-Q(34) synthetase GluQRS [Oceanobacter kriegii]|uniref:tRNA glutamyl-Q(34) synthetase GluQRS n=1 Tax=Oceanobacter kriegii TaxID=64972 RepID=UPI0004014A92|nr:tRNA glutamyl-Q(34) synthetase GluQRS [Oceanobacter kriegii]